MEGLPLALSVEYDPERILAGITEISCERCEYVKVKIRLIHIPPRTVGSVYAQICDTISTYLLLHNYVNSEKTTLS